MGVLYKGWTERAEGDGEGPIVWKDAALLNKKRNPHGAWQNHAIVGTEDVEGRMGFLRGNWRFFDPTRDSIGKLGDTKDWEERYEKAEFGPLYP